MRYIRPIPIDAFVPGNLYGEIWEATWTRSHVWRHYYVVYYSCTITEYYTCTDSDGKSSTCSRQVESTCSRTEYNEMTTTDTRIDTVALTLRAMENSRTSIRLNYSGGVFASMNDVKEAYTARDVEYEITHTDRGLTDAYELYKSNIFDPNMMDNIKNQNLNGIYEEQGYSI